MSEDLKNILWSYMYCQCWYKCCSHRVVYVKQLYVYDYHCLNPQSFVTSSTIKVVSKNLKHYKITKLCKLLHCKFSKFWKAFSNFMRRLHTFGIIIFDTKMYCFSCIMVCGEIKGYHQYYKSFVSLLTTGCDTIMQQLFWTQIKCEIIK